MDTDHLPQHLSEAGVKPRMNADRRRRFGEGAPMLALLCECGDPDCRQTVLLSPDEYDAMQPGVVLHPSHRPAR